MRQHKSKLESANVVAWFDNQDDADEAVLGLRIAGIPDKRIGYYYPMLNGLMVDLLAQYHRFAASVIGTIMGGAMGIWVGLLIARMWYPAGVNPDMLGLEATCGIIGALCLGTAGGMIGLWTVQPGKFAPAPEGPVEPFVLSVDAPDAGEAQMILRKHGGHEMEKHVSAHVA